MNVFIAILFPLLIVILLSCYLVNDGVYCVVTDASDESINGYYVGIGGLYEKFGMKLTVIPDIFDILELRRNFDGVVTITLSEDAWTINKDSNKDIIYITKPDQPELYLYNPPESGWTGVEESDVSSPKVSCKGSLQESPSHAAIEASNIETLLFRPITTTTLIAIFYVAYYLWANRIEVSAVSFSYYSFVDTKEYWRAVTASFSHFDLLHLGFNTMSLYQLGILETVYGSVKYAYLSVDMVFITILLCVGMTHVLITRYGRADLLHQQAVGYSCVLFGWMVAASVRMDKFCPIFLLPSLCFTTWWIPIPFSTSSNGLPVNIGPFILLVLTKIIMPQSSFMGHLSGIIIGYPLAWNMLDWLTPPLFFSALTLLVVASRKLYFWDFPGVELTTDLNDFVPADQISRYKVLQLFAAIFSISAKLAIIFLNHWMQLLPRLTGILLVFGAVQGRKSLWMTDLRSAQQDCQDLIFLAIFFLTFLAVYDIASLAAVAAGAEIVLNAGLSKQYFIWGLVLIISLVVSEVGCIVAAILCLQDVRTAAPLLTRMRLDAVNARSDLQALGLARSSSAIAAANAFSGTGHRLYAGVPVQAATAVAVVGYGDDPESAILLPPVSGGGGGGSGSGVAGGSSSPKETLVEDAKDLGAANSKRPLAYEL